MGSTYTRQSSAGIVDGGVIEASDLNNEFDQLLAAFAVSTGHSHDGTAAEGGPVAKLLSNTLTFGAGTAGTDITITFDGETSDGVMYWMEDEDHFKFADDVVIDSSKRLYLYDEGGEYIYGDGTDLYLTSGADINIPANIGMTFGNDGEKIEGDGTDLTITGNTINLTATTDVALAANTGLLLAGTEKIESDGTDLSITVGAGGDINIGSDIGLTFGNDGEKIEGDGTDLTITGNNIKLTATADVVIPADVGITFGTGEKIEGNSTDLTVTSGADINLTATSDVNIPSGVGVTFGNDGEKIEGDGTDLTIAGNNINLTAVADVVIPADVGITFGSGEKIEGNSTDLTVTSGADINLTATSDVNIPSGVGVTFGNDGEKIEGDGTDLTIAGNNINLTAVADVVIPNNVGIQFGGASEKIEGDGTDLTISANNLTVDAAADINLDAGGEDIILKDDGTQYGAFTNTSGNLIIKSGSTTMLTGSGANATFAGNLSIGGDLDVTGSFDMSDANITNIGSIALDTITNDGTDITLDSSGDIILDAAGDTIFLKDAGTTFGSLDNSSSNLIIKSGTTTAATFSGANVTLAGTVGSGAITSTGAIQGTTITATSAFAGTLSTAAQTNITSLGTLTALTVDDVAINGKVVTMTGSASDTAVFTAGTNGTLSIVTTDDAAAAANIQITADGTVDIDSAGVLTLDSGAAINIEPASGSAILLDGTISVDAGVVTGATSITSTAFVGDITGDVTGNASGTAATVTTAAQTNITSLGTLTTLTVDNVIINGTTIGHTSDTDLLTLADAALTAKGTITVGVDDTGHDVKFFGASAGAYALWDESANLLDLRGATAAGPGHLKLTTGELTVVDADILGRIDFQAPLESDGTDAILVGASIYAEADDTFAAGVNNTDLVFALGKSETAAEKFRFTADGEIGIGGANYGSDGQVLTSAGAGAAAAWETPSSAAISSYTNSTNNRVITSVDSSTVNGEANLTFDGSVLAATGNITATGTIEPAGDTASSDNAAIGYTSGEGLILTGQGSTNDVTIKNDADGDVISIPTGTTNVTIAGDLTISGDDLFMATNTSGALLVGDGTNYNPVVMSGAASIATNGAVTIANDAIDSQHYADGSIDNAHLADDAVDSDELAAGAVDTAHIADDQITLAKMASGTDGNIISYDASGNPVAIATGTDGQVLTSTGAGSPPAFEDASGGSNARDAVGTYAICRIWDASSTAGGTTAGSYLSFASSVSGSWSYSGTPSGTWRCMGIGGAEGRFELWIRTA